MTRDAVGRAARRVSAAEAESESWLETFARLALLAAGVPPPVLQLPFYDAAGRVQFRGDMGWPRACFITEYDGAAYHSSAPQVRRDRDRQNQLVAQRGWGLARYGYAEVVHGTATFVAEVVSALRMRGIAVRGR